MSNSYVTNAGDTFEGISRNEYGTEFESDRIAQANPGASEPFVKGIKLIIPVLPTKPKNKVPDAVFANSDEVSILIDGKRFRFWDTVSITSPMDAMTIVEFSAPFEAGANESTTDFLKTFKPFGYKTVTVHLAGSLIFTGIMISINPLLENTQRIVSVSCYSLPAVLNDCMAAQVEELEFRGVGLKEITETLVKPFGLSVVFDDDQGAIFEHVVLNPNKKILAFLIDLAKQRNLIISDTPRGELLFHKSVTSGKVVARLRQGESPILSIAPVFKPQEYYSHITGIESESIGFSSSKYTVKNPHLSGVLRPFNFDAPDTEGADIKSVVEAKAGRMLANVVSYSVNVNTWHTPGGSRWQSNEFITLHSHDAMIFTDYKFIIRNIVFNRNATTKTATLQLVIPGAFSGTIPESMPWDE